jgi:hypothetical protein
MLEEEEEEEKASMSYEFSTKEQTSFQISNKVSLILRALDLGVFFIMKRVNLHSFFT